METPWLGRIVGALSALVGVTLLGIVGYLLMGFTLLEAAYQTVTTLATVGFEEVRPFDTPTTVFTIVLIVVGVGVVLYNLGLLLEAITEGHLPSYLRRRRMERSIKDLHGHVIICGFGRVGQAAAEQLCAAGKTVVVMDRDADRFAGVDLLSLATDVLDDDHLIAAGIEHAASLICALDTDAENVYLTLSARALRPDLVIIARARTVDAKEKLVRAGATRAVNPQLIGGRRMATFALDQHVAEFLDGVMHDEGFDARIDQFELAPDSELVGSTLGAAQIPSRTGAQVLAIRRPGGREFVSNPPPDEPLEVGCNLIVFGDEGQLAYADALVSGPTTSARAGGVSSS